MASRGRGHRGCPQGTGQAPPVFDQQALVEAVGPNMLEMGKDL